MKAKAPEKIHILPNAHNGWLEGKIPNCFPDGIFVEYTRTDAFIEKACECIEYNNKNGGCLFDGWRKDFIKFLESEL